MATALIGTNKKIDEIRHEALLEIRSFSSSFALILAVVITAFLIQHLDPRFSQPATFGGWVTLSLLAFWVGMLFILRRRLFWVLTSYQFAVSILTALTVAVAMGTFILQSAPPEEYFHIYGNTITAVIFSFFLNDLFHSFWFGSLLLLTVASLLMVLVKRNPFRLTHFGFLLSHGGIILILAGALAGSFLGETGVIDLFEGESAESMRITSSDRFTGEARNLGFALKLEDFQVDYYKGDAKIYVYRLERDTGRYLAVGSYKIQENAVHKIPGADTSFRIVNVTTGDIPSAQIEITGLNGISDATVTGHDQSPLFLNNRELVLTIDRRDDEVKEYRSLVSIWQNGVERDRAVIQVNHPLKYKGYSFYQSNFDPKNLSYSGIQVVKDPGLSIVYAGFIFMSAGVVFIFYVRPKLVERARRKQGGEE